MTGLLLRLVTTRAGLITIILVGSVLGVTLISYSLIQYGRSIQTLETEVERSEAQQQTRERIDRAVREHSRPSTPDSNREWLQQRQDRIR